MPTPAAGRPPHRRFRRAPRRRATRCARAVLVHDPYRRVVRGGVVAVEGAVLIGVAIVEGVAVLVEAVAPLLGHERIHARIVIVAVALSRDAVAVLVDGTVARSPPEAVGEG